MANKPTSEETAGRPRRWLRWIAGLLCVVALVLLAAPWVIAKTGLRDQLINSAIGGDDVVVGTRGATFGYLTPMAIEGLSVKVTDGSADIQIESIAAEESWLVMLLSPEDLGTFTFLNPKVNVVTGIAGSSESAKPVDAPPDGQPEGTEPLPAEPLPSEPDSETPTREATLPQMAAVIEGAGITVRHAGQTDPAVDLQDLSVSFRVEHREQGSVVVIDPVTLLDQQTLSPELCGQGLQLVAPMLADGVDVQGKLSLRLDRFLVPVGEMEEQQRSALLDIAGEIKLDGVSVALTNPLTAKLFELAASLGDRELPDALTVAEATAVRFHVNDGRIYHEGLTFLLPYNKSSLSIASHGSVGVDETIDLELAVTLPGKLLGHSMLTKFLVEEPLLIHVGGTVEEPTIDLPQQEGWASRLDAILGRGADEIGNGGPIAAADGAPAAETGDSPMEVAESILGIVGGLLENADRRDESASGGLRQRLQDRRQRRRGE